MQASATAIQQHTVPNPPPDASAPATDPNAYNWHWATPASGDVHYLWWGLKNYSKRSVQIGSHLRTHDEDLFFGGGGYPQLSKLTI